MLAQFFSLVLVNTYSWFGGQGYCAYDFAVIEQANAYENVEITLRPQYDPQNTASGNTELQDETITLESLGTSGIDSQQAVKIETDCSVTGFVVVKARAVQDGKAVDLLQQKAVEIQTYQPLPLTIGE
ncbi:IrmA family protein [Rhizobium sp. LjRoot30]|uniref:IrmA family protein n=1 Tax=Rhizobium sp. LjRoot30 TaxID=3342320 RepID=UPI003ED100D1